DAKLFSHGSLPALCDLDVLLSDLLLLERFRLGLLAQQGTGGGLEALLELLDGLLEGLGGFVLELAALPDVVQNALVLTLQVGQEIFLEAAYVLHRYLVHVATGTGPDGID